MTDKVGQCLTPSFREQLPDRGCSHLREEGSSMDGTEVREVAIEIELLCYHSEPSLLRGKDNITEHTLIIPAQYMIVKVYMEAFTFIYM